MIAGQLDEESTRLLSETLPWMRACLDWLKQERPWSPETESVGQGISVKKVEYETRSPSPCRFESHQRELDLQVVLEGAEWIDIARLADVGEATQRDTDGDVLFYAAPGTPVTKLLLGEGRFAIFFPEDVHRCGASVVEDARLRKYVFKISRAAYSL